jgi:CheY-like chemotaxis protein
MRIVLIHWKPAEAGERLDQLKAAGFEASVLAPNGSAGLKGTTLEYAKVIVIDLSRLPMQGRAVAIELRKRAPTRRVPLVFVGGALDKVESIRELLPDAGYTDWSGIEEAIQRAARQAPVSPVVPDTMAGYSGTPLAKKLGFKSGTVVGLLGAPEGFEEKLEPLPDGVRVCNHARGAGRALLFVDSMRDLHRRWAPTIGAVAEGATVWVAWPKKASGIVTDVTEAAVRAHGLERGWVDYKICAIDETWSGLAFAKRKTAKA